MSEKDKVTMDPWLSDTINKAEKKAKKEVEKHSLDYSAFI